MGENQPVTAVPVRNEAACPSTVAHGMFPPFVLHKSVWIPDGAILEKDCFFNIVAFCNGWK